MKHMPRYSKILHIPNTCSNQSTINTHAGGSFATNAYDTVLELVNDDVLCILVRALTYREHILISAIVKHTPS